VSRPKRPGKIKRVALVFPASISWLAVLARGVTDYARQHAGWEFTTSPPTLSEAEEIVLTVRGLRGWPGDGAIATISDQGAARAARRLGIPVVCVGGNLRECSLPRVMVDQYAVGRLAADHLLELGLRQLAFYGLRGLWYSEERQRGFVDRARKAGVACAVFDSPPITDANANWRQRRGPLNQWLPSLRLPVGIMAVHDYRARIVADECARLGLEVPHDVAVLGVNNDQTTCEFCHPTLSSVSRSAWQIGYEAAGMLDRLMAGQSLPGRDVIVQPDGIVPRRSTDTIAVDDPHVTAAVRFMRDHVGEAFGIERVMQHVSVSRRRLHEQFQRLLGRTPYGYLCQLRVERAKRLLAAPERIKMQKTANACGFSSSARMRLVFQRVTGTTPLAYHRRHGGVTGAKSADPSRQAATSDGAA
jgi:LacI family transcriptional regulator